MTVTTAPLHRIALATCARDGDAASAEASWLAAQRDALIAAAGEPVDLGEWLARWRRAPPAGDARLAMLSATWQLSTAELLAVALACAAETDAMIGRVLAWLQAPVGGARPTLGLIAMLAERFGDDTAFAALAGGMARASGLFQFEGNSRVLPEAALSVPLPVVFALADAPLGLAPPGVRVGMAELPMLSPSLREAAAARARALAPGGALVVRSGHPREARAAAVEIAAARGARAAFLEGEPPSSFAPWLALTGCLPVWCAEIAPGERRRLPDLPGWRGPWLIAAGPDGSFERDGETLPSWRVPVPCAEERIGLWHAATGERDLAEMLGAAHRHPAGRIAELGRASRFQARLAGADRLTAADVTLAARNGASGDLGTLAELLPEPIPDEALVLPPTTRREIEGLAARCIARDALAERLGPAARARYRPGVRALLVGPSGTGKTLAVAWLATRLALPLYRVDLASITSKYIGETEKNLAQLFARAEHAEGVLLFDEADSLFGKRTDVKEANDRFANAQTNYLLQRIESFEGIAILTSNSRARFDSAFTRRLDAVVEFAPPGPEERRALWIAHLGGAHTLGTAALNRYAANCELAGGHIRNAVFAAAVAARDHARPISEADLTAALAAEYRKLGKPLPTALMSGSGP
jgi:ATPase family associated with various cellular activities (AAA)